MPRIAPSLWFDDNAEDAVAFYLSIFPNSRILDISHFPRSEHPAHAGREGKVMAISFELDGLRFTAINGGPYFKFNEAVSLQIECASQREMDRYWRKLSAGGSPGPCGWLKDKFGLSWQINPRGLASLFQSKDPAANERVMKTMLRMKKLNLASLKAAAKGKPARKKHPKNS